MKKWLIPAALLAAAGAALLFTSIRFSGFLLISAAVVLAVLGALRNKKAARRGGDVRKHFKRGSA